MAADLALVEDQGQGIGQKPIRILVYDGQRFWLAQKRLSKGRFVWWPSGHEPTWVLGGPSGTDAAGGRQPGCERRAMWRSVSV